MNATITKDFKGWERWCFKGNISHCNVTIEGKGLHLDLLGVFWRLWCFTTKTSEKIVNPVGTLGGFLCVKAASGHVDRISTWSFGWIVSRNPVTFKLTVWCFKESNCRMERVVCWRWGGDEHRGSRCVGLTFLTERRWRAAWAASQIGHFGGIGSRVREGGFRQSSLGSFSHERKESWSNILFQYYVLYELYLIQATCRLETSIYSCYNN